MSYLGRVPHIWRPAGSAAADQAVLYAFDDVLIVVWIKPTLLGAFGLRREPMPKPLRELDAVPPDKVSVGNALDRSQRQPSVHSTEAISSAILARSKFFGAVLGASRIELTFGEGEVAVFYASRRVTQPLADILEATLGQRFENRRP